MSRARCDRCGRFVGEQPDPDLEATGESGGLCWREMNPVPEVCLGWRSFEGERLSLKYGDMRATAVRRERDAYFKVLIGPELYVVNAADMATALDMLADYCGPGWTIDHERTIPAGTDG